MPKKDVNGKMNVIMVGPDVNVQGGISSVVSIYIQGGLGKKVNLFLVSTHKDGNIITKIFVFVKAFMNFIVTVLKLKHSIVHIHLSQKGSFFRKLNIFFWAKVLNQPVVVHLHGSEFEMFMRKNGLLTFLTKYVFNHADLVLVTSDLWKNKLEKFSTNRDIRIFYNPSVLEERRYIKKNKVHILFLGRLGRRKGIYDLLECILEHRKYFQESRACFILAGDGDIKKVKDFVKEHALDEIVKIPGWVTKDKKKALLEESDILILPSYNEQMPMSILEAMGYGYPIIATDVAGIPEMVVNEDNGFLMKPGDKEKLFTALEKLCRDEALRRAMGERSRVIVKEKFHISIVLENLLNEYKALY